MCSNCRTVVILGLPRAGRWAEGPRTAFWRLSQTATIPYMLAIYTLHFWAPAAPGPLWATRLAWLPAWLRVVGPRAPELNCGGCPKPLQFLICSLYIHFTLLGSGGSRTSLGDPAGLAGLAGLAACLAACLAGLAA